MNKKILLTIAGAATAFASGTLISDYALRKGVHKRANPTELILGISGLVSSAAVLAYAYLAATEEKDDYEDMLNDEDIALMDANISEVLGASVEHTEKPLSLRLIEVDDEATIEDFI